MLAQQNTQSADRLFSPPETPNRLQSEAAARKFWLADLAARFVSCDDLKKNCHEIGVYCEW
jgi:hypothetical protein